MNIAFVWYWGKASEFYPNWRDGLRAALEIIGRKHTVSWFMDEKIPPKDGKFDFILFWGDSNCPFFDQIHEYSGKKGICLSTDPYNFDNLRKLDVVYCESTPVLEAVRRQGIRAIKAFGTDTEFYFPPPDDYGKDIEYFYPATFSPWKRQSELAHLGNDLLCVGTLQPDGTEELEACVEKNVQIELGYFPPEKIREYYRRAKRVVIPAVHGSERTVLESMAMNIYPEVTNPVNIKTRSYIEEFQQSGCLYPREFIIRDYSATRYAEALLRGME